jgi:hypothetical protein
VKSRSTVTTRRGLVLRFALDDFDVADGTLVFIASRSVS